jgi:hypothetical protein
MIFATIIGGATGIFCFVLAIMMRDTSGTYGDWR